MTPSFPARRSSDLFADNLKGLADLVAGAGTTAIESTLRKVQANQGWPLSLIVQTGEIGGYRLSTTEAQLVEKLASEGIVKPPMIRFGGRTESFLFTPKPGGTRLNAANRESGSASCRERVGQ